MSLTPEELERYARHIMLRELGGPGQQKLLKAHVALVGLGALGGPAAMYLAAAGVGRLTLIDDDSVTPLQPAAPGPVPTQRTSAGARWTSPPER